MTDSRVKYLKFVEGKPLLFSSIATGILCASSLCGLLIEEHQSCKPDLRLWLIIVIIRSAFRLLCRLYLAWKLTEMDRIMMRGDLHASAKCVDILDVFGIVWFAVGNLLVFNNFDCISVSPIVFFSSLSYVCLSYVGFFLPSMLRCSLGICRPTHEEDIRYLRQTADVDREVGMITLVGAGERGPASVSAMYSPDLTRERSQFWTTWLEGYGCFAVSYHPSMNLREKSGGAGDSAKAAEAEGGGNTSAATAAGSASNGYAALNTKNSADVQVTVDVESGALAIGTAPEGPDQGQAQGQGPGAAYWHVPMVEQGQEEGDYCSVCLLPFEGPPASNSNNSYPGHLSSSSGAVTGASAPAAGSALTNIEEGGAGANGASADAVEENNNIIVRYPCRGHHYFHAHCLHSWLQVASARYLNTRRGGRLFASEDHTLQVTCPCCREHPHNVSITAPVEGAGSGSTAVHNIGNSDAGRVSSSGGTGADGHRLLALQIMRM